MIDAASLNNIEAGIANATSQINKMTTVTSNTGVEFSITDGRDFRNGCARYGNIVFVDFDCSCSQFAPWEVWEIGTAPIPICNKWTCGLCFMQNDSTAPNILDLQVTTEGKIRIQNKSGTTIPGGWLFGKVVYVCV